MYLGVLGPETVEPRRLGTGLEVALVPGQFVMGWGSAATSERVGGWGLDVES